MKKSLNKPTMAICAIIAVLLIFALLPIGCANSKPKPMPSQESVDAVMQTFAKLEHAFGLCIIVGCPTRVGSSNPFSLEETKAQIAQGKEDLAFLHGIKSAKIFEDVKAYAYAYKQYATQANADRLFDVLDACIKSVKRDLQAPLWQERVTPIYSHKTEIYVEYLQYQVTELSSGNALVPANDTPKKLRPTPSYAEVEQVYDVFSPLEQALRLCIEDVKAHRPDVMRKNTQKQAEQMFDLPFKEKEFRNSVGFILLVRNALASAQSYFTTPSPEESEKLFDLLQELITDIKADTQLPIWRELVTQAHTDLVLEYASQLEQHLNQKGFGN